MRQASETAYYYLFAAIEAIDKQLGKASRTSIQS